MYARMPGAAIDAARIWYETEPSSMQALQALTGLLISAKRQEEALPYLQKLLAAEGAAGDGFLQLNRLLANNQDKALTLKLVQQLAQPYPKSRRRISPSPRRPRAPEQKRTRPGRSARGVQAQAGLGPGRAA